jgi:hypothetical protein
MGARSDKELPDPQPIDTRARKLAASLFAETDEDLRAGEEGES